MDENNNQEIYEDENMERLKKASKDTTKKAARKLGKVAKKEIKEVLKKLLALIPPQVWAIIIGVILGVILLAAFWWAITSTTFDSISDIAKSNTTDGSGNIKAITTIDEDNRKLVIDSEALIDEVDQWFEDNKIEPSTLGFYDDEDYATLVKFLEAETVSSFPDLRERAKIGTPVEEGELQGTVQFKRKYSDGSEQLLEYKEYEDFRKELAKLGEKLDEEETQDQIYFSKDEVEKAYNDLKTYFTLDEDYNLIIVTLQSTETKTTFSGYAKEEGNSDQSTYDFNINVTKVNYQTVIQKYTMPFEFPLALLLITRNPKFCEEVAKLSLTSQEGDALTKVSFEPKIVVDIQDNLTSTYVKEDYGYTANFKLQDYVKYSLIITNKKGVLVHQEDGITLNPYPIEVEKVVSASSYRVIETWINTTTSQLCVSEAITWIADYTSVYSKVDETIGPDITNSSEGSDGGYSEVPDYHGYLANQDFAYSLPSSSTSVSNTQATYVSEEKKILEMKTDKNTEITTTTNTTKYNKSSSKVEPKWERFLSLLKIESKEEMFNLKDLTKNDTLIKYEMKDSTSDVSPENNLLSGRVGLYTLLASNSKTVTFEEIMRELIGIYTGKIKADEAEFDFSIYEPGEFITLSSGIYGGTIQEKVWFALKNLGYSDIQVAAAMGNIDYESGGFSPSAVEGGSGNGIGLIQWSFGRRTQLEAYANSKGVSWKDEDTQVEFLIAEISGQGPASTYATRRTSGYIRSEGKSHTATHSDWATATTIEDATLAFMRFFESPASTSSYSERCNRARTYYNEFQGRVAPTATGGITGELGDKANFIVAWAEQQVGKTIFYNSHNGRMENSNQRCAAFAKSAYYEAGLGYLSGNAIDIPYTNAIQYDASGKVDCSNIPIGAFIVSSGTSAYGHVALYAGNGYVIEAGGKTIVKQPIDSSYGRGKFLGWSCGN